MNTYFSVVYLLNEKFDKDDFFKRFTEIENCIDKAVKSMNYSRINVYYNHYYSSTTFAFKKIKAFSIDVFRNNKAFNSLKVYYSILFHKTTYNINKISKTPPCPNFLFYFLKSYNTLLNITITTWFVWITYKITQQVYIVFKYFKPFFDNISRKFIITVSR